MKGRALLTLILLGAAGATPARAATCRPTHLSLQRHPGSSVARLTWRGPAGAHGYRVLRNGRVVGQTAGRSLAMGVVPGHRYLFTVRPLEARGGCAARRRISVRFAAPATPSHVAVAHVTEAAATLSWRAARPGDGRLAGYRVLRDGAVVRQTRARTLRVGLPTGRSHVLAVAAVDTQGHRSRPSRGIRVSAGHVAPSRPAGLSAVAVSATAVTLTWSASRVPTGRVVGYRIVRDGSVVTQAEATQATVAGLAPSTGYKFSVAAVDGRGYVGATSAPVNVTTSAPPPTQGALHAFLLASTDQSFDDLRAHYTQVGTVYPTYFECGADGGLQGQDDVHVTQWAQQRRIAVLPRFNCQTGSTLHRILTDPATRAGVLDTLAGTVQQSGFDGVNLDFEAGYASDRAALTSFVGDLADRLHALGRRDRKSTRLNSSH